jgi:hypothetical protein
VPVIAPLGRILRNSSCPERPPDSRQTQRLIAALGIAMPLATNWQASLRRRRTISAFCFPLIRAFTMKCTMQRVHGFCASYWLSQRTASLIKSAWVVGRQLGITFACSLAFSIREHLLQPNCIAKRGARSASLCLFSSNTPFRLDLGGSVPQSKRLLRH